VSPPPRKRAADTRATAGRSLLVLAQPSPETDDLLAELVGRPHLHILRVVTVEAAAVALRDVEVALALICPETGVASVYALLDEIDRWRPGIPVLAVRARLGEDGAAWKARGVGILRAPLMPQVLSRTVDVALGLAGC
jgi:hypothetical protein